MLGLSIHGDTMRERTRRWEMPCVHGTWLTSNAICKGHPRIGMLLNSASDMAWPYSI